MFRTNFSTRLALVSVAASVIALTLSCALLALWQYSAARHELEAQNRRIAEVLASSAGAPVVFQDVAAMNEIISATLKNAVAVALVDRAGRILAERRTSLNPLPIPPARTRSATITWRDAQMRIIVPIIVTSELVGWLDMTIAGPSLAAMALRALLVGGSMLAIAAIAAVLATRRLQPLVMLPMSRLLRTIEDVTRLNDFSLRVPSSGNPDIDRVLAAFNLMVGELEQREAALAKTLTALETARDSAEQANAAKSRFLAAMSHELRTPLNAVIAYGELVEEDLQAEASMHLDDMRVINASARHLLVLINEVLDFAKVESRQVSLDLHSFDIEPLVREVEATLKPLAARNGNDVSVEIQPELPPALLDSTKLRQCLINLGGNACKFTSNGTIVIRVSWIPDHDCISFQVADTGVGMSEELIGRLFVPFSQADASTTRQYGGTGLGLAITDEFVRLMSGKILVSSQPGQGSTFSIILPRRLPRTAPHLIELPERSALP